MQAIVNGLSGAMGRETALALARRDIVIAGFALAGSSLVSEVDIPETKQRIQLCDTVDEFSAKVAEFRLQHAGVLLVAIDFTHPTKMNSNADLYNQLCIPFVMGTTGGDLKEMANGVEKFRNLAVIAPNMGKQVVAFQAMFEYMQDTFPGSFQGYDVSVTESHQSTKADTSGTAKAVCQSLAKLVNKPVEEESITKLRTDEDSKRFGVEEQYLLGHAHHTYRLTSADKTVVFEFKHNVNGRSTYAEGVVDAVLFLANKLQEKSSKKNCVHVFDMVDVLKQGEMK